MMVSVNVVQMLLKNSLLVKKFFIVIVLIAIDFISKKIIFSNISLNSFLTIIPILDITHIHNYGISFGLFSGIIPSWIIIIIGLTIVSVIIYMTTRASTKIEKWGLIFIIAGAIANIIDRIMNNYVLDFIYLHYRDFYWPAFNFADIYITFGAFMILYIFIKEFKKKLQNNVTS